MRTETIQIFEFSELGETEKANVLANFADINTESNWWDMSYEGFAELAAMCNVSNFKVTSFDTQQELITCTHLYLYMCVYLWAITAKGAAVFFAPSLAF